jgi:glucokinase-like ROK family protein
MVRYRRGDNTLVREMNLSSVLGHLHQDGPMSRAQLAKLINLQKPTISSLVEDLIDRGLIFESGIESSGVGRPATMLRLNPNAGCIIGAEIGVGYISIVLANFIGEILWQNFEEFESLSQQEQIIAHVFRLVDEAREFTHTCENRLLGIGLALPGLVDVENGLLVFSPNLQWHDVPLRNLFYEHTGLPVFVDNDANAAALGEHLFGVARKAQHFLFIVDSVGVGGGLFLNGDLYRGANGLAGEIGHTSLYFDQSHPCRCGNNGCWENTANLSSLYDRVRARIEVGRPSAITSLLKNGKSPLSLSIITQAAEVGDVEALEALYETGSALGRGIANLINIFNPEMIVVGGTLSLASKFILPSVKKIVEERALEHLRNNIVISDSAFGPDASVLGAAALVVQAIFSNPTTVESVQDILASEL